MENNLSQETLIIIVIAAAVALLIGFLIGRVSNSSSSGKAVSNANNELEEYKQSVSEHFGKTADLVDNLTQSYKEVFDHLGTSAQTLLTEEQVQKHITSRAAHAVTLAYTKSDDDKIAHTETTPEQKDEQSTTQAEKGEKTENTEKSTTETDNTETQKTETVDVTKDILESGRKPEATKSSAAEAVKTSEQKSADLLKQVAQKTGTS